MNIFYLDRDPNIAAQLMCDSHVVKMCLETAQLLSTAHRVLDNPPATAGFYRATHVNHPSAVWARKTNNNYNWLYYHFGCLLIEYNYRYGKVHGCTKMTRILLSPPRNIPVGPLTTMPCCMPDEYKISKDPVVNYREYYKVGKAHLHKYTKRAPPEWLNS